MLYHLVRSAWPLYIIQYFTKDWRHQQALNLRECFGERKHEKSLLGALYDNFSRGVMDSTTHSC